MPLYEFVCEICGFYQEELQKITDPAPKCPKDKSEMKKELSTFKTRRGAGLYSLDTPSPQKLGDLE